MTDILWRILRKKGIGHKSMIELWNFLKFFLVIIINMAQFFGITPKNLLCVCVCV